MQDRADLGMRRLLGHGGRSGLPAGAVEACFLHRLIQPSRVGDKPRHVGDGRSPRAGTHGLCLSFFHDYSLFNSLRRQQSTDRNPVIHRRSGDASRAARTERDHQSLDGGGSGRGDSQATHRLLPGCGSVRGAGFRRLRVDLPSVASARSVGPPSWSPEDAGPRRQGQRPSCRCGSHARGRACVARWPH